MSARDLWTLAQRLEELAIWLEAKRWKTQLTLRRAVVQTGERAVAASKEQTK
jgi:hypothetical protein